MARSLRIERPGAWYQESRDVTPIPRHTFPHNNDGTTTQEVAKIESSVDGLKSLRTAFGLASTTVKTVPSSGSWTVTETAPDGSKVINLAGWQRFIKINYDDAHVRRSCATYAFGILGIRADPAIPALLEILQQPLADRDQWTVPPRWAGDALAQIGRSAARPVAELLAKPDYIPRHRVLNLLEQFRPGEAEPAIPALMRCLTESKEAEFRNRAAHCIHMIARSNCDALVAMNIARLDDPNRFARRNAAYELGRIGQEATNAVTALLNRPCFDPLTPAGSLETVKMAR
jgi:hypothetical protein